MDLTGSNSANRRLFDACDQGDLDATKQAVGDDANVNHVDQRFGLTGLAMAAHKDHPNSSEIITYLLEQGAKPDTSAVFETVNFGLSKILTILLKYGADADAVNPNGTTPLWLSALRGSRPGSTECVRILLEAGANPNVATKHRAPTQAMHSGTNLLGETPLHCAAAFGDAEMVRLLLDAGADPNAPDGDGHTPIQWYGRYQRREQAHIMMTDRTIPELLNRHEDNPSA